MAETSRRDSFPDPWEAIRYLSNHEAAMFIFCMLENKRGWVPFRRR